jgi:multiple antibiotic resistance protein
VKKKNLEALEKGQLPPARLRAIPAPVNPSNVSHSWELILGTVAGLLPVINPLATTPTFLAITEGDSQEKRLEQLRRACFYMVAILVGALVFGTFIMNAFGISIPGLRIAGGMLVAGIGWRMLLGPAEQTQHSEHATPAARAKPDVSFSPLAMPMLSGPGSIAVTVGFASLATAWFDYAAIILGILIVAGISYATLRLSTRVVVVIGSNGMNALTKLMGFLLVCVGIQFVVNGIIGVAAEPALVRAMRDALQSRP